MVFKQDSIFIFFVYLETRSLKQVLSGNLNDNIVIDTAANPGYSRRGEDLTMIALFVRGTDLWYFLSKRNDGWRIKVWHRGFFFIVTFNQNF